MNPERYDIAIIGSGIAGSALGAILTRHGCRVVIFEAGSHPRFAIGESMILETSETLRAMAELFDVPELAYPSSESYLPYLGTSHGVKRHFGYLYHRPGQPHRLDESLQAVIPRQPYGHELHLYRQDCDFLIMQAAVGYGATVLQKKPVTDIEIGPHGVTIEAGDTRFEVDYVVDAAGFRSPIAAKYDLRHHEMETHSRALFTHMLDVPCFHEVGPSMQEYGLPFRMSEGTLHHLFPGGWLWVIPFNNHTGSTNPLVSVGLMLDPRVHPVREDLSPQDEFYSFVAGFPDLCRQFESARSVRDWTRTGRIQYGSTRIVGERFALLGHAAGFVDPLFSKGLYVSLMSTGLLAHHLIEAVRERDFDSARFAPVEQLTQNYLRANDRHIAAAYTSLGNAGLWNVFSVLWLLGAYTELVKLSAIRGVSTDRGDYYQQALGLRLVGGGFDEYDRVADAIYADFRALEEGTGVTSDEVSARARERLEALTWLPNAFRQVLHGKNHLAANKLRLGLLSGSDSFLGTGAYRRHFFGDRTMAEVTRFFVSEKVRYAQSTLALKRRFTFLRRHRHTIGTP